MNKDSLITDSQQPEVRDDRKAWQSPIVEIQMVEETASTSTDNTDGAIGS
jgi:hypothetical protein